MKIETLPLVGRNLSRNDTAVWRERPRPAEDRGREAALLFGLHFLRLNPPPRRRTQPGRLRSPLLAALFRTKAVRWLGLLAMAVTLLGTANLQAQSSQTETTVTTLGGGPQYYNPDSSFGYSNSIYGTLYSQFHTPSGIAVDNALDLLYVADRDNNAVRYLDLISGQTYTLAPYPPYIPTNLISQPVGVAVDALDNVYVLNRGNGHNGSVVEIDFYGDYITNMTGLTDARGIALDTHGDIYVTTSNTVFRITSPGVSNVVATITSPGVNLQGIVMKRSGANAGWLAVCDAGRDGIYLINPTNGVVMTNAGFNGVGDGTGLNNRGIANSQAQFFQPSGLAEAGDGSLIVADFGNNRVKLVGASGYTTNLYGVASNYWWSGTTGSGGAAWPGWSDGAVWQPDTVGDVQARMPFGIAIDSKGNIYTTEDYYHIIREVSGANIAPPLPFPPPAPTSPVATAGYGQVQLTWTASGTATNYNVKRAIVSGGEATIASTSATSYTDVGAPDGTTNYYVISALNTGGEGENSAEVSAVPLFSPAPTVTSVKTNYGLVSLSWSVSAGATSYHIKRAPAYLGPYTTIASTASTSYDDTNVIDGTTYYYVVSAVNPGGENPTNSPAVSATPPLPPVPDPQIGWVTFPPPDFVSVFHVGSQAGHTFNNDVPIVIVGAAGSQTFYTYSNTPAISNVPDPTSVSSSAPVGYQDGLSSIAGLTVAQIMPTLAIKAIGEQSGHPNSAVVSALFQFVVANPGIYGDNAAQFTVSNITVGAQMYYTTDGSNPTNDGSGTSIGPIASGQTLSLNFGESSNLLVKIRGFKTDYQPSSIVSNMFSKANFVANSISFGRSAGEPSSHFLARPGQFYYAPVTLELLPHFGKMYSLQFNVTVTNGLVNTNTGVRPPPIENGAGIDFFSMLMAQVPPSEGQYYPPADGQWYLPIPPYIPDLIGGQTNMIPSAFVNTNNNLLGIGWLYRTGFKYSATDTNGLTTLDFDTTKQDLTAYSIAHDTLFKESDGTVVVGAYSFLIPTNASVGDKYFIQIGSPSATSDGVGAPGASIYIQPPPTNRAVKVASPEYLVGDVAPFHWLNAGDFGDSNLDNSDVMQVYQSAILGVNMPPANSDLYLAMDSAGGVGLFDKAHGYWVDSVNYTNQFGVGSLTNLWDGNDQTINQMPFGDGRLDINDLYVTFRRSLDTSLVWFKRYWTNGQFVAVSTPNLAFNTNIPAMDLTKTGVQSATKTDGQTSSYLQSSILFSAGDALGSPGQTVQIPITAHVFGSYPLRVLGLNLTVYPLDGSPDLTQPVQFTPAAGLGQPTAPFSTIKGNDTYAAAWLDSTIAGISSNGVVGTLTVTIPANANSMSAYVVHFNVASGSPNGLVTFPAHTFTGLITLSSRTNSYYNDGIPDSWRLRWFGTIYNLLSVSNACPSGDGIDNWEKYVAGVDPLTPNDFPSVNAVTPPPAGSAMSISWPTVNGKHYAILSSPTLFPGQWTTNSIVNGTGANMEFDDHSTGPTKFYRVLILP